MKTKFLRMKHVIRTLNDDGTFEDKHHFTAHKNPDVKIPSISAAKRASRALQIENGGMGRGSLRVVDSLAGTSGLSPAATTSPGLRDDELAVAERYKAATLV
jgi:hypothetical protein